MSLLPLLAAAARASSASASASSPSKASASAAAASMMLLLVMASVIPSYRVEIPRDASLRSPGRAGYWKWKEEEEEEEERDKKEGRGSRSGSREESKCIKTRNDSLPAPPPLLSSISFLATRR